MQYYFKNSAIFKTKKEKFSLFIFTIHFLLISNSIKMVKELLVTAAAVAIGVIIASFVQKKFIKDSWEESYEVD